ncbi:ADP-ribosylglycohydrolase family protein [Corallococcus sp. CA049B]|uniref:ADP-ribosylglycohydrolase family protein n=1 Tax=Corallococcus sp. CA049B TaxID=2316730 RepID=UPI0013150442|nr:ADP-ribosylglycohydrolase family protein [Corallococcus sp. CA049B]
MSSDNVKNSALWAAYGDALGFISEFVKNSEVLERHVGVGRVVRPLSWRRRVGGRFGPEIALPAGCYSDDTQLRLATSRAIQGDGSFDVEAFAKVELPVWLSYALGAGKGSRAAASALGRTEVTWSTNFFSSGNSRYVDGGGNGAAMRVQPHVWASSSKRDAHELLADVCRNAVVTHGHPRGILGAVFHALSLRLVMLRGEHLDVPALREVIDWLPSVVGIFKADAALGEVWLDMWEHATGASFEREIRRCVEEVVADWEILARLVKAGVSDSYREAVLSLRGTDATVRGSGAKTALLAGYLAWQYRDDPQGGMVEAANCFGSDTDTIATMAGALWGAVCGTPPPSEVMDWSYISAEADRLASIARGEVALTFAYPDLLRWSPPKAQIDAVGTAAGRTVLAGLGEARFLGESAVSADAHGEAEYRWLGLSFGQTVLVRHRTVLLELGAGMLPRAGVKMISRQKDLNVPGEQRALFGEPHLGHGGEKGQNPRAGARLREERISGRRVSIDEAFNRVVGSNFDPELIGRFVLELSAGDEGIEQAVAFVAIVAKARRVRIRSPS